MNPKLTARILVALSVAYGIVVGILAVLHTSGLAAFATIGGIVLGGLWAIRGVLGNRAGSR
jgi:hypothetical protein